MKVKVEEQFKTDHIITSDHIIKVRWYNKKQDHDCKWQAAMSATKQQNKEVLHKQKYKNGLDMKNSIRKSKVHNTDIYEKDVKGPGEQVSERKRNEKS